MPPKTDLFTLEEDRWYAWQMLPGYGSLGHYYSSIRISRVEPKKRGDGTLQLEFYNTADATTRWGTGHTAGVINIVTGRF